MSPKEDPHNRSFHLRIFPSGGMKVDVVGFLQQKRKESIVHVQAST